MLTDKNLVEQSSHPISFVGGVIRRYEVGNFALTCINGPGAHAFPYDWEVAVWRDDNIVYDTPLTGDVEVFFSDEETNEFIEKCFEYFEDHRRG